MMEPDQHLEDQQQGSESLMEKITEKIHHDDSSSSSDDESKKKLPLETNVPADKTVPSDGKTRLFGRKKPVHSVFGGGKSADIILWRDKQIAAGILVGVTVVWVLFEWLGYHLLTFVCHSLILSLAVLFLWSNLASFVNKAPPKFPDIVIPEDLFVSIALSVRYEFNRAFTTFKAIASGKDLPKFLKAIAILWVISVIGSWFNLLTLFYIVYVILHTVPLLYEKHEDHVDTMAEKAMVEINKHYSALDEKVLQKLPKCSFVKGKKQH